MTAPVMAYANRKSNADLIADCARLGYLNPDDLVLDPTYGRGVFWRKWQPAGLFKYDVNPKKAHYVDVRDMPFPDNHFDAVVFDPPYKLNGTGAESEERYGVDGEYVSIKDRHSLLFGGMTECARVLKPNGHLLVKCQDQVSAGKVRWQTIEAANHAGTIGLRLVDSLLFPSYRKQPAGTRQVHARRNYSTMLIFRKEANR